MTPSLSYFAGFFDGEGTIGLIPASRATTHRAYIRVDQVDRRPLDELAARFGGTVSGPRKRGPGRRPVYYWQRFSRQAELVVRALLPFLIVKRGEAEILLGHQAAITNGNSSRPSPWERAERESYVEALRELRIHDDVVRLGQGAA